jgi:hypothetical protein
VVVAAAAGACSVRAGYPFYRQQAALREIERVHGSVLETRPGGPKWLRERLGDKRMTLFDEVVNVNLGGTNATDGTLAHVSCLTKLEHCSFGGTTVSDAGLVHLRGMASLQSLYLVNTRVTDEGLKNLTGLRQLRWLWLDNTNVTDAGLTHIKKLTELREVWVAGTHVTDAGSEELQRALPGLTVVR